MTFYYPNIAKDSQASLPTLLTEPTPLPQAFEDSSHQLWLCSTEVGECVLKVSRTDAIAESSFWQGMNTLFLIQFPQTLDTAGFTHHFIEEQGGLSVPPFIASSAGTFVLTGFMAGEDLRTEQLTQQDVIDLATHLGQIHQNSTDSWGALDQPRLPAQAWSTQLQNTLVLLRESSELVVTPELFEQAMMQAALIEEKSFVPIMPDLRWDQLRRLNSGALAVVDLDAFVIGPITLEWVLLEYLLTPEQMVVFQSVYADYQSIPNLNGCRECYRLLLFLMNVLGERDIQDWFANPSLI